LNRLKQLDIEVMKRLHDRVNLIPVIAKADTMTSEEIKAFKSTVLNVISEQKLQIYEFPDIDDDDVESNRNNNLLKSKLPFAVIGSNKIIESDGKSFRGRQYPWGVVNIDELNHCDFIALRTMLIRTHMQDLKDVTNNVHYENYRFKKLAYVSGSDRFAKPTNKNPFQQLEEQRKESELKLEDMKREMESVFDQKVKEKINRLKESELSLEKQQEAMRHSLEKEERELEEKRIQFLREKQQWEDANRDDEERFKHTLEKEADKKKKKIF
jgi:septin 7